MLSRIPGRCLGMYTAHPGESPADLRHADLFSLLCFGSGAHRTGIVDPRTLRSRSLVTGSNPKIANILKMHTSLANKISYIQ